MAIPDCIWLKKVSSTNDAAKELLDTMADCSVIVSEEQTSGRGQGLHLWHSNSGENLTFSVILRHNGKLAASDAASLTHMTALSVLKVLESYGIEARVKLPNDIMCGGRKICGILIENTILNGLLINSCIGIGLNVNETDFPSDIPQAVSMKMLTGSGFDRAEVLASLQKEIRRFRAGTVSESGRISLQEEFGKYLISSPEEP